MKKIIQNLFTSSSSWKGFAGTLVALVMFGHALLYGFIILMDIDGIYNTFPLSKPLHTNHRMLKAGIINRGEYDGAVIGDSTLMLLNPSRLTAMSDGKFASLAFPSASPHEQIQVLKHFIRKTDDIRYLIIQANPFCEKASRPKYPAGQSQFPERLYDWTWLNDFPNYGVTRLKDSVRRLQRLVAEYNPDAPTYDGFDEFTNPDHEYDLVKAKEKLYREDDGVLLPVQENVTFSFPWLELLAKQLRRLSDTQVVLVYAPKHHHIYYPKDTAQFQYQEACKHSYARLASELPNIQILNFQMPSPITTEDSNFWDSIHYRIGIAETVEQEIVRALDDASYISSLFERIE